MRRSNELRIVRTDVLLWALGGFADPPAEATDGNALPVTLGRRIQEIARRRTRYGEIARLAAQWDRPSGVLRTLICRARQGQVPEYRRA